MTLQGFDKRLGTQTAWVAVPLELVDWMAANFGGPFTAYLASLDPYSSVPVADDMLTRANAELLTIQSALRTQKCDVPAKVDLFGDYGIPGAKKTVKQMIEFFESAVEDEWKVVSVGD